MMRHYCCLSSSIFEPLSFLPVTHQSFASVAVGQLVPACQRNCCLTALEKLGLLVQASCLVRIASKYVVLVIHE
jgi:hypothetical protein